MRGIMVPGLLRSARLGVTRDEVEHPMRMGQSIATSDANAGSRRSHRFFLSRRRLWAVLIALSAACGVLRFAAYDGVSRVVRISGGSMAESFRGAHLVIGCEDCGVAFRIDIAGLRVERRVCPNCGYVNAPTDHDSPRPGQRVMIDRWPRWTGRLSRGDVIAINDPEHPGEKVVKRIVGMPGETIEVRDGDLYANGRIVRASFAQYRAGAVMVHDDRFRPQRTANAPPRWRPADSALPWFQESDGYHLVSSQVDFERSPIAVDDSSRGWAWLEYHHWRCSESPRPRFDDAPILDNDSYNQAIPRMLQSAHDLGMSCWVSSSARAELAFRLRGGYGNWELRLACDGLGAELFHEGVLADKVKLSAFRANQEVKVEVALCDQQFFLAINDRIVLVHEFELDAERRDDELTPLAIGVYRGSDANEAGVDVRVRAIQVWRDRFYLGPRRSPEQWSTIQPVPPGCFAVLGDNPPLSIDSREWPIDAIGWQAIVGRVMARNE